MKITMVRARTTVCVSVRRTMGSVRSVARRLGLAESEPVGYLKDWLIVVAVERRGVVEAWFPFCIVRRLHSVSPDEVRQQ